MHLHRALMFQASSLQLFRRGTGTTKGALGGLSLRRKRAVGRARRKRGPGPV